MNRMLYTPPVTKNLLIINILAFFAFYVLGQRGINLNDLLGLHFFLSSDFEGWQFLTYMFLHANLQHIFFNMFALWMFGRIMEQTWGPKNFLVFYLVCGIGAGVCQELWQFGQFYLDGLDQYNMVNLEGTLVPMNQYLNNWTTVGASGAVYGVLLGFGLSYPEERIFIFPVPFPIKAKWFVLFYAVIEVFSAFFTNDNTAHFAHLGGMLFGYLLMRRWKNQAQRKSGFNGWENYRAPKKSLSRRWKEKWDELKQRRKKDDRFSSSTESRKKPKTDQAEIDRILEKVRRSGYNSLSEEEKKKLFDQDRRG